MGKHNDGTMALMAAYTNPALQAFDDAVKGGSRALDAAMNVTQWVRRLHEADMCAARIDERKVEGI